MVYKNWFRISTMLLFYWFILKVKQNHSTWNKFIQTTAQRQNKTSLFVLSADVKINGVTLFFFFHLFVEFWVFFLFFSQPFHLLFTHAIITWIWLMMIFVLILFEFRQLKIIININFITLQPSIICQKKGVKLSNLRKDCHLLQDIHDKWLYIIKLTYNILARNRKWVGNKWAQRLPTNSHFKLRNAISKLAKI